MNRYSIDSIEQSGFCSSIICKEKGRCFSLINNSNFYIQKIRVDGKLIKAGNKCDYAIDASKKDNTEKIFLIELKGSDLSHACKQIQETYTFFKNKYQSNQYLFRIIVSKFKKPELNSIEYKKLKILEKTDNINIKISSIKDQEII